MAFSVKAGVILIWHQKINFKMILFISGYNIDDSYIFGGLNLPVLATPSDLCLCLPFLTLVYYRVLSSCCLLFMMFHTLVHVSLPPVSQCDVLAGVLCMLCMLYTVCSTYLSCLFVQWAANIPAL